MSIDESATRLYISDDILESWQNIVDIMSELISVPAGLIMRIDDSDIEVLVSSKGKNNPYHPGDREKLLGSGLYCETVIKTKEKLLIPNALTSEKWKNNPDIKLNMVSYLGFPLLFPDETPFGTICVLDTKENKYSDIYEKLIFNLRETIHSHLALIYMNHTLGEEKKELTEYISEIKTLRGILPICAQCKKIRDDKGYWNQIEGYIQKHSDAQFSHGICPECAKKLYPNLELPE